MYSRSLNGYIELLNYFLFPALASALKFRLSMNIVLSNINFFFKENYPQPKSIVIWICLPLTVDYLPLGKPPKITVTEQTDVSDNLGQIQKYYKFA